MQLTLCKQQIFARFYNHQCTRKKVQGDYCTQHYKQLNKTEMGSDLKKEVTQLLNAFKQSNRALPDGGEAMMNLLIRQQARIDELEAELAKISKSKFLIEERLV